MSSSTRTSAPHDAGVILARTGCTYSIASTSHPIILLPKLFAPAASATKIFAAGGQTRHCANRRRPAARAARARGLTLLFSSGGPACRCSNRPAPSCPRRSLRRNRTASVYLLLALYCWRTPAFFIGLQSWSRRLLSSAAPGIRARTAPLQRPHFFPKVARGAAQRALREDRSYGQIARRTPYDQWRSSFGRARYS